MYHTDTLPLKPSGIPSRTAASAAPRGWAPQTLGRVTRPRGIDEACRRLVPLLGRIARCFARRLPSHVELDDLMGAGAVGLVTAVQQHHEKPAEELKRLVKHRIHGAILDHLRNLDHLSRRQRAAVSAMTRVKLRLASEGCDSGVERVAQVLGMSRERAEAIGSQLAAVQLSSLDDSGPLPAGDLDPAELAADRQMTARLVAALQELPERLQTVLSLCYCEDLTYTEIGELLGISRSRVCQLHNQALAELRRRLPKLA